MKTVAIVAEYNPFHNGHLYQINKIREIFGDDTAIIAIMSGNYTQRGELAIADKTVRAQAAVDCGVNLVLEIPFPFSASSAEFYAKSAVRIADSIGVIDYLVFGSEIGDLEHLKSVSEVMMSDEFSSTVKKLKASPKHTHDGHPKLCELAYNTITGIEDSSDLFSPNNILAIEYIKALTKAPSKIIPFTIKRKGAGYDQSFTDGEPIQSASAIRELIADNFDTALEYIPNNAKNAFLTAFLAGSSPTDEEKLGAAVISSLRLNAPTVKRNVHDAAGGLYNRLHNASYEATSISTLMSISETKKYTKARLKRAMWYSYFGVTSSKMRKLPLFTQILALDAIGRKLLKEIKNVSDFPVITKPSSYSAYSEDVRVQKELSNSADSVFTLAQKKPITGKFPLMFTPYVKK